MTAPTPLTGSCLYGAVTLTAIPSDHNVTACHCDMCRRWSSGPYLEVACDNLHVEGRDHITTYRSSEWAERGFCNRCGSNLYYHIIDADEYQIAAGLIGFPSDFQTRHAGLH